MFELGFITGDVYLLALASGIAAVLGLLAHVLSKNLKYGGSISFVLPKVYNGKIQFGSSITVVIVAFVVGVLTMNYVAAFAIGFAGAQAVRDAFYRYFPKTG